MTIYLIRHGKTEANKRWLYCGSTDLPLCEEGISELRQLMYRIPDARFLTSGMKRTEQTLQILFGDIVHEQEPMFREVDFGIFEMHSYAQLKDTPEYQAWLSGNNEYNIPPGGESGQQMKQRVLSAFEKLQEMGKDTVLITHGGVIAAIMESKFPKENKSRYDWQPKNGHGYMLWDDQYCPIPEEISSQSKS